PAVKPPAPARGRGARPRRSAARPWRSQNWCRGSASVNLIVADAFPFPRASRAAPALTASPGGPASSLCPDFKSVLNDSEIGPKLHGDCRLPVIVVNRFVDGLTRPARDDRRHIHARSA